MLFFAVSERTFITLESVLKVWFSCCIWFCSSRYCMFCAACCVSIALNDDASVVVLEEALTAVALDGLAVS